MKLWTLALLAAALPAAAVARPPTAILDVEVGGERFFRAFVEGMAVDDPSIVAAELLPSHEVLLTAKAPGRAFIYLLAEGSLEVVLVRVRELGGKAPELRASEADKAVAKKACPGFKEDQERGERTLTARVPTDGCRKALLKVLEADDYLARNLDLSFEIETLQAQLAAVQEGLKAKGLEKAYQVAYSGPTLRIKGKGTGPQLLALLQVAFENSAGRVLVDDQSEHVTVLPAPEAPK